MVTVIIPALNEAATIGQVVQFAFNCSFVSEVIVVDDQSTDDTIIKAIEANAKLIISKKRGKGISMREGLAVAQNEIIIFLDADINPYPTHTIEEMIAPLIYDTHDFVKSSFGRNEGRVTELVAKPLLQILFPDMQQFDQPLSGMIAGRKAFFEKVKFHDDYGVDIGILIDMHLLQARIAEVYIGYIKNKSKPWQALNRMSTEVARVIIEKALTHKIPAAYQAHYKFLLR